MLPRRPCREHAGMKERPLSAIFQPGRQPRPAGGRPATSHRPASSLVGLRSMNSTSHASTVLVLESCCVLVTWRGRRRPFRGGLVASDPPSLDPGGSRGSNLPRAARQPPGRGRKGRSSLRGTTHAPQRPAPWRRVPGLIDLVEHHAPGLGIRGRLGALKRLVPASTSTHRAFLRPLVANLRGEEPDAGNLHFRICGGLGAATPGATRYRDRYLVRKRYSEK